MPEGIFAVIGLYSTMTHLVDFLVELRFINACIIYFVLITRVLYVLLLSF